MTKKIFLLIFSAILLTTATAEAQTNRQQQLLRDFFSIFNYEIGRIMNTTMHPTNSVRNVTISSISNGQVRFDVHWTTMFGRNHICSFVLHVNGNGFFTHITTTSCSSSSARCGFVYNTDRNANILLSITEGYGFETINHPAIQRHENRNGYRFHAFGAREAATAMLFLIWWEAEGYFLY